MFGLGDESERRVPVATAAVVAVTALLTGLNVAYPTVAATLGRNPDALAAGEWWRLLTPLFVQPDRWWQILVVLGGVAVLGVAAERIYGTRRWLLLYFGAGFVGELVGYAWQPLGAGASVAGAGLLGALCVWLLERRQSLPSRVSLWGIGWLAVGVVLTAVRDIHGPPLLVGACLAFVMRRRETESRPTR